MAVWVVVGVIAEFRDALSQQVAGVRADTRPLHGHLERDRRHVRDTDAT